ncbi:immunity protein YezG family protein [Bacillus sp. N1-1]|uniref:immunity protein YezG family protein n=1 Tax=Bacillus sp. N1-1 TaxID=2682541 RepID=UPI001316F2C2|nr:immunity protein YezG family protein [Bacillus sp. N1-1]QHA91161.1 DUF600 family protein [Bacillus sp. N1-1]
MSFETKLNELYKEIAQQVNDMIPTEWNNLFFNGEVKDGEGGVFFFFTPKGEEQHVFSHYIPKLYSVDKRAYKKELHKLFQLTVELQKVFTDFDQDPWFSVTLLLNDTGKLKVHFDYTNWHESEFGPTDRIKYFEYKYVNQNKEKIDLGLIGRMKEFEEK